MNLSIEYFIGFLKALNEYSGKCESIAKHRDESIRSAESVCAKKTEDEKRRMELSLRDISDQYYQSFEQYRQEAVRALSSTSKNRDEDIRRIDYYKSCLLEIAKSREIVAYDHQYKEQISAIAEDQAVQHLVSTGITADNMKDHIEDYRKTIRTLNQFSSRQTRSKNFLEICRQAATFEKGATRILTSAIETLQSGFFSDKAEIDATRDTKWRDFLSKEDNCSNKAGSTIERYHHDFATRLFTIEQKCDKEIQDAVMSYKVNIRNLRKKFLEQYPPSEIEDAIFRLRSLEPDPNAYVCAKENPASVKIGDLTYESEKLKLGEEARHLMRTYYPVLTKDGFGDNGKVSQLITMPDCINFDSDFNYLFYSNTSNRERVVDQVRSVVMRLFMAIPPSKVNFLFFDPITLGETFAPFARLVEVDDRTSKVINGKIWTSSSDIEDKLKTTTDHIANINQRCLQGKFDNIQDYNVEAGQNAEAYRIITVMDFPARFTEASLRMLEQIVSTGPKCGVFTVLVFSDEQYEKCDERRVKPLVNALIKNFTAIKTTGAVVFFPDKLVFQKSVRIDIPGFLSNEELNKVVPVLKSGIKNSDKVVMGIEQIEKKKEMLDISEDSTHGIRIPIGFHGANEIQHLTLGVGGSHHALIAGVAGAGKSSLIHTIIFRALTQYDPDNLQIYLVDFKRGVEFKIYADHKLPSFRVVAIESEREFGYNILMELEREQKIRANKFKKHRNAKIDRIEDYCEQIEKIPRILVIMDEFHELFSEGDSLARRSAQILERIVRQGRAFGIHLILASQSYTNIKNIDKAVFDQMTVRIVLKCSKGDANMLLDDGASAVEMIPIDDPGRAIYNSEAGTSEFNSHFRVAYIDPKKHNEMLEEISRKYASFYDEKNHTRILLANIEDNQYSIFNQFQHYKPGSIEDESNLQIGETMSISNDMKLVFNDQQNANLLVAGNDSDKARSIFVFSLLSLCINYYVNHLTLPAEPFIYVINYKPLNDGYFEDILKKAGETLRPYIRYISSGDESGIKEAVASLYAGLGNSNHKQKKYFFVFGYQRAEELKSTVKLYGEERIRDAFGIMAEKKDKSFKDMFSDILSRGPSNGIHTIIWQDSFSALDVEDRNFASFFNLKIAFAMSESEFSRFVGENNVELLGENNAIFYNKSADNQKIRPYQMPNEDWVNDICNILMDKPESAEAPEILSAPVEEEKPAEAAKPAEKKENKKTSGAASFFDL